MPEEPCLVQKLSRTGVEAACIKMTRCCIGESLHLWLHSLFRRSFAVWGLQKHFVRWEDGRHNRFLLPSKVTYVSCHQRYHLLWRRLCRRVDLRNFSVSGIWDANCVLWCSTSSSPSPCPLDCAPRLACLGREIGSKDKKSTRA